jgi:HTH-type transcriptional regulator/antitoxin HipB
MDFPINTSAQLQAVLRGLRKARGLSQAETGTRIGVNQKRIARIEAAPGVTGFDQIARIVSALGGRLVIQDLTDQAAATKPSGKGKSKGDW